MIMLFKYNASFLNVSVHLFLRSTDFLFSDEWLIELLKLKTSCSNFALSLYTIRINFI